MDFVGSSFSAFEFVRQGDSTYDWLQALSSQGTADVVILLFEMGQRSSRKKHDCLADIVAQIEPDRGKEIQLIEWSPVENSAGFSAFSFVGFTEIFVTRF